MSEFGLFWDSRGGDRVYNAGSMEEWLKPFFVSGVHDGDLQVTSTGGMGISVAPGYCHINGKVRQFDTDTTFTLGAASGTGTRVDTVVIERNDGDRNIFLKVVRGGSDGQPVEPVRGGGVYQLVLAQITIERGVVEITQSDIKDTRMNSLLCGWIASTVDEINFDQAYAQFTAWFNEYKQSIIHDYDDEGVIAQQIFEEWFDHIKGQLSSDAAGHLQLEIDQKQNVEHWDTITLYASRWIDDGGGTYFYMLSDIYPENEYDITDILPNSDTTEEMRSAWRKADCAGYSQSNAITAHKRKPEINLVMSACVRPKIIS